MNGSFTKTSYIVLQKKENGIDIENYFVSLNRSKWEKLY